MENLLYTPNTVIKRDIPGREDSALFPDYTIYMCPIRQMFSFAIEDKWGLYWTAPQWCVTGDIYQLNEDYVEDGIQINVHMHDINYGAMPSVIAQRVEPYIRALNGEPCDTEHVFLDHPGFFRFLIAPRNEIEETIFSQKSDGFLIITPAIIALGPSTPEYTQARQEWENIFGNFYPGPENAVLSPHQVSIRNARVKHKRHILITKKRRQEKKISRAINAMEQTE